MQIFDAVLNRQLGPTRPIAPLSETEKARLRELVTQHAPHLRRKQFTTLEDKLHVRTCMQTCLQLHCQETWPPILCLTVE